MVVLLNAAVYVAKEIKLFGANGILNLIVIIIIFTKTLGNFTFGITLRTSNK